MYMDESPLIANLLFAFSPHGLVTAAAKSLRNIIILFFNIKELFKSLRALWKKPKSLNLRIGIHGWKSFVISLIMVKHYQVAVTVIARDTILKESWHYGRYCLILIRRLLQGSARPSWSPVMSIWSKKVHKTKNIRIQILRGGSKATFF